MSDTLMISVSGMRGHVGTDLTPELVARHAAALGAWVRSAAPEGGARPAVVLGRDARTSGPIDAAADFSRGGSTAMGRVWMWVGVVAMAATAFGQGDGDRLTPETFQKLEFRSIGPSLTTGRISDIAVDPKNANVWYVAASAGNLWKTENRGNTWTPIFESYGSYSLGAVVYGFKWPDPSPTYFGFHEIFHAFTIAAFIVHYIGVSLLAYQQH